MDAEVQLDAFIDKYTPEMASLTRALLARMKARLPGATLLVFDNYNGLVIGFGPNERTRLAILSLAVMPRWVNLFFLWGIRLSDPHGLLQGGGKQVRFIRLTDPEALDDPRIDALIGQALDQADVPIDPAAASRLVVKMVLAKQRRRRP
jgi:hypothetical protein